MYLTPASHPCLNYAWLEFIFIFVFVLLFQEKFVSLNSFTILYFPTSSSMSSHDPSRVDVPYTSHLAFNTLQVFHFSAQWQVMVLHHFLEFQE